MVVIVYYRVWGRGVEFEARWGSPACHYFCLINEWEVTKVLPKYTYSLKSCGIDTVTIVRLWLWLQYSTYVRSVPRAGGL